MASILCVESFSLWINIGLFSVWGGVVRFLMKIRGRRRKKWFMPLLSQLIVSGFAGFLSGVYAMEHGSSYNMIMLTAAASSTLGGTLLRHVWQFISKRFTSWEHNN
ncbi:phage holin family protein [Enterobacter kobei]|uniref:phage holin family protein n=1 Tax=Enterobacter kobei TaxID=208224 RepID=UPI003CF58ADF